MVYKRKPGRRLKQTNQHPKGEGKTNYNKAAERSPTASPHPSSPGLGTAILPVNITLRTQPRGLSFTSVGPPVSTNAPVPKKNNLSISSLTNNVGKGTSPKSNITNRRSNVLEHPSQGTKK